MLLPAKEVLDLRRRADGIEPVPGLGEWDVNLEAMEKEEALARERGWRQWAAALRPHALLVLLYARRPFWGKRDQSTVPLQGTMADNP